MQQPDSTCLAKAESEGGREGLKKEGSSMGEEKIELIQLAYRRYKNIEPCGTQESFAECFTKSDDELMFWFNTEEGSTRLVTTSMIQD